jgi:hypothetical protein
LTCPSVFIDLDIIRRSFEYNRVGNFHDSSTPAGQVPNRDRLLSADPKGRLKARKLKEEGKSRGYTA